MTVKEKAGVMVIKCDRGGCKRRLARRQGRRLWTPATLRMLARMRYRWHAAAGPDAAVRDSRDLCPGHSPR